MNGLLCFRDDRTRRSPPGDMWWGCKVDLVLGVFDAADRGARLQNVTQHQSE